MANTTDTVDDSIYLIALKVTTLLEYMMPLVNTLVESGIVSHGNKYAAVQFRKTAMELCNKVFHANETNSTVQEEYEQLMGHITESLDTVYAEYGLD